MKPLEIKLYCPRCRPNRGCNIKHKYLRKAKNLTRKDWRHKIINN